MERNKLDFFKIVILALLISFTLSSLKTLWKESINKEAQERKQKMFECFLKVVLG